MRKTWSESDTRRRSRNRLAFGAAALLLLAIALQQTAFFSPARERLHRTRLEPGRHDFSRLHYALIERNLVEFAPGASLPSTEAAPKELVADGLPTLSIVTGEEGLLSPTYGITTNIWKRGRFWERRASFSYFEKGELHGESMIGLRLHGGGSRQDRVKSFKIIFRRGYSAKIASPPGLFFEGESAPMRRFVLSNTSNFSRFLNTVAQDLASQVGCEISRFQPARVCLNGEELPVGYFLWEHQSRDLLQARYGHNRFLWVRLKPSVERRDFSLRSFSRFMRWVRRHPVPHTMEELGAQFDLDGLSAWVLAVTFLGTTDEDQGGYYRDMTDPKAPWRTLAWDFDGSFNRRGDTESDLFRFGELRGARGRIFRTLMQDDPAYRHAFREKAREAFEGPFSEAALRAHFDKYRALLESSLFVHQRDQRYRIDEAETYLLERRTHYLEALDAYSRKVGHPRIAHGSPEI